MTTVSKTTDTQAKKMDDENGIPISDILGVVASPNSKYQFTDKPLLEELADVAEDMGTHVFKTNFWHARHITKGDRSLVEAARRPEYDSLFRRDFSKIVLTTHPILGGQASKWMNGVTKEIAREIRDEIYDLTKYILTTYKNTGKLFVFQNWEADQLMRLWDKSEEEQKIAVKAFADWINMIQDGVTLAREEVGMEGVWVVFAAETNHVPGFKFWEYPTLMTTAFPQTSCDLYSASMWSSSCKGLGTKETLDYYKKYAADSLLFGKKNIYYGEFGSKEYDFFGRTCTREHLKGEIGPRKEYDDYTGLQKLAEEKRELQEALKWGVQFLCHWTVYCNGLIPGETLDEGENAPNEKLMGVWLIRADGSKTPTYEYYKSLMDNNVKHYHPERVKALRNFAPGEKTSYRRPTDLSEFEE